MSSKKEGEVEAEVILIKDGKDKRGRYVLTTVQNDKNQSIQITFSLQYWNEEDEPVPGEIVFLGKIRRLKKGWRAYLARRVPFKSTRETEKDSE